jgi:hypothetical protein
MTGMNASILPIIKPTDQEADLNHDRSVALNAQHAQEFFEPEITAKAANLRSGYEDKISDNALQLTYWKAKCRSSNSR